MNHVVQNWSDFAIQYLVDMSLQNTRGSACELSAAGQIYPFIFEVYCDGTLVYFSTSNSFVCTHPYFTAGHAQATKLKTPTKCTKFLVVHDCKLENFWTTCYLIAFVRRREGIGHIYRVAEKI